MELLWDGSSSNLSRFSSDLELFSAPVPQVLLWTSPSVSDERPAVGYRDNVGSKTLEETDSATLRDYYQNISAPMQHQEQPRYAQQSIHNPGYTPSDSPTGVSNITDHNKPPLPSGIAGSGGTGSPAVAVGSSPANMYPVNAGYSQAQLDAHQRAMMAARVTTGSPARTVSPTNSQVPQQQHVNSGQNSNMSNQQGNVNQISGSVPAPKPGPQLVQKGGSNYSSPRSSIGSFDSKGSSPRTSLVNPPPPPPYDFQRHGSPVSGGVASPRSSVSATSLDSKHSSPRTSITGISKYDKIPSPRGSIANDKYWNQQGGMRTQALMDRYNEPAPPPPYDPRMKGGSQMSPQMSPSHVSNNYPNISSSPAMNRVSRQGITVPVTLSQSHGGGNQQRNAFQATLNQSPSHQQKTLMQNVTNKLPGLNYDIVKKSQDNEAERKVAALTRQLESELGMSGSPSSLRKGVMDTIPTKPPPPYHGPHITEPFSHSYNPPNYSTPKNDLSASSSLSSTPSSSRLNLSGNMKSPLPYQVTPPLPKGPTEAEKKVEALTAELENQFEKNPQGEYFGRSLNPHQSYLLFYVQFYCPQFNGQNIVVVSEGCYVHFTSRYSDVLTLIFIFAELTV